MNIKNTEELFHELSLLWALHMLGGKADDDIRFPKFNEILESVISHKWSIDDLVNKMIEDGYPKDNLESFLKSHGISISLEDETMH